MKNQPIIQVDVENELLRLVNLLEHETENFEALAVDGAKKESAFKKVWASTYLTAEGSIRNREATADLGNSDAMFLYKLSEALVKAKREKLLFLRTSIDALRSLNANVRVQTFD
jgi:hypothetical protein